MGRNEDPCGLGPSGRRGCGAGPECTRPVSCVRRGCPCCSGGSGTLSSGRADHGHHPPHQRPWNPLRFWSFGGFLTSLSELLLAAFVDQPGDIVFGNAEGFGFGLGNSLDLLPVLPKAEALGITEDD